MLRKILFLVLVSLFVLIGSVSAKDEITEIRLNVFPDTQKIRPFETAVIQAEFYGKKKRGFFESIFGAADSKSSQIQSNDWKAVVSGKENGWLSKPFLFQDEVEKTKSGIENFLKQSLGIASAKDSVLFTAPSKPGKYTIEITEGKLSKQVTVTVSNSAQSSNNAEVYEFLPNSVNTDPRFYLAEHYAPFIAQETWFNPKADYLARFDYDKNWKGDDNWENLEIGSSQAFVYYTVMETETHWYLIYNFFHSRDYSDVCVAGTCHENDNEGLILTVRKDDSKFGKLEVMETLAHNNIYSFTNEKEIGKGVHDIDGKFDLFEKVRPMIFIEAGGHGIYASDFRASVFSAETMEFKQNTGVTYVYKGKAESPKNSNDRNVGYALLPIFDEWWSRGNQENSSANETFEDFYVYQPLGDRPGANAKFISGAFKGRTARENMAKPFWAWHDNKTKNKKVLSKGQWALDPAYSVSINLSFPSDKPVSTEYIFNPYLRKE